MVDARNEQLPWEPCTSMIYPAGVASRRGPRMKPLRGKCSLAARTQGSFPIHRDNHWAERFNAFGVTRQTPIDRPHSCGSEFKFAPPLRVLGQGEAALKPMRVSVFTHFWEIGCFGGQIWTLLWSVTLRRQSLVCQTLAVTLRRQSGAFQIDAVTLRHQSFV